MKKLLFALAAIVAPLTVSAQALPTGLTDGVNYDFTVLNISQGNKDATQIGARAGDVLRYEVRVSSETDDVKDFITSVDVSEITKVADIIDSGLGKVDGMTLTYPAFSHLAPCDKTFTFFARVKKDCGTMSGVKVIANDVATLNVQLNCEEKAPAAAPVETEIPEDAPLVQVGPNGNWMIAFIGFLCILLVIQFASRKEGGA